MCLFNISKEDTQNQFVGTTDVFGSTRVQEKKHLQSQKKMGKKRHFSV